MNTIMNWHFTTRPNLLLNPLYFIIFCTFLTINVDAQQLAFPTAEGFARHITGGRGGKVIYVTNLNDSGSGSFREAVQSSGARTVVFNVSGTITLNSPIQINNDDLTIAGQTSPNGVTIRRHPVYVRASNVIIRYMRFRLGDEAGKSGYDALSLFGSSKKISGLIVDHCSISWARDECLSVIGSPQNSSASVTNVTVQWTIMSEGLADHAFGGFVKYQANNVSFLKNLFAHNTQRNPNYNGVKGSIVNNVLYNIRGRGITVDAGCQSNIIGNYIKTGPGTNRPQEHMMVIGSSTGSVSNGLYLMGNYHSQRRTNVNDGNEWAVMDPKASQSQYGRNTPHNFNEGIQVLSASEAFEQVKAKAGSSKARDAVDIRIINDINNNTGKNNISSQSAVGGWPNIPMGTPYADSDKDGMEDNWEIAVGLSPSNPNDHSGDRNNDGYTNLEEYLNCIIIGDCQSETPDPPANTAPTVSSISNQTIDENTTLGPVDFTVGDNESNESNLSVTAGSSNTSLVPNGNIQISGNGQDRQITINPASNVNGQTVITIEVSDGQLAASTTFNLNINEVETPPENTSPTISSINDQVTDENVPVGPIGFTVSDAESSNGALNLSAACDNSGLIPSGNIQLSGNGSNRQITITPATNATGNATVTVSVSDGKLSASTSFDVEVKDVVSPPQNTPPSLSSISNQSVMNDATLGPISFKMTDEETDSDQLQLTVSSDDQSVISNSNIQIGGSGENRVLTITPIEDVVGSCKITLMVSDGQYSDQETFSINVLDNSESNDPPADDDEDVILYPNPTFNNYIYVRFDPSIKRAEVKIYDMKRRQRVCEDYRNWDQSTDDNVLTVPLRRMPSGTYMVKIKYISNSTNHGRFSTRMVKRD